MKISFEHTDAFRKTATPPPKNIIYASKGSSQHGSCKMFSNDCMFYSEPILNTRTTARIQRTDFKGANRDIVTSISIANCQLPCIYTECLLPKSPPNQATRNDSRNDNGSPVAPHGSYSKPVHGRLDTRKRP